MSFTQLEFFVLLACTVLACLALRGRNAKAVLLVASYVFYGWWDWRFLSLIVLSTAIDYVCGLLADPTRTDPSRRAVRTGAVAASAVANLSILGVFKYFDFFALSFAEAAAAVGLDVEPRLLGVVLPAGISFYTFQSMSYTIDAYHGRIRATTRILDLMLYVAFFPQLVAGPIERGANLLPQIERGVRLGWSRFQSALPLFLLGFFKKRVIADALAPMVDATFARPDATGLEYFLAGNAFALQIYCDFSGYTDMARGLARLFGIDLMENFRAPFLARNPRDFWRRWHISLSTWFRDYLYIPLGGDRGGRARTLRNLALTMVLCGFWHGAGLNFILWGFFHAALLVGYRLITRARPAAKPARGGSLASGVLWTLLFFELNALGWIVFRCSNEQAQVLRVFSSMGAALLDPSQWALSIGSAFDAGALTRLALSFALILPHELAVQRAGSSEPYLRWPWPARAGLYIGLLHGLLHFQPRGAVDFIYFQF